MQDRPTARELVEAVVTFLETEIVPSLTDPRLRFRGLIAANVLGVVARELADENVSSRDERLQLATLLGQSVTDVPVQDADLQSEVRTMSRELSYRIRSGACDESVIFETALHFAELTLVSKLRINNPRYLRRVGIQV